MNNYMKIIVNAIKQWVNEKFAYINDTLTKKVDVVEGKGLSTEDFTTEHKNKLDSLVNVQSDWNQTDEAAQDYIKNRTHGEVVGWNALVENIESQYFGEKTNNDGEVISYGYENIDLNTLVEDQYRFTKDNLYKVVINGVEYVLQAKVSLQDEYNEYVWLGNSSLYGNYISEDTQEDFLILNYKRASQHTSSTTLYTKDRLDSVTISIYEIGQYTKQLDEVYIPNTIARKNNITWEDVKDRPMVTEIVEEVLVNNLTYEDYNSGNIPDCNFIVGQTYKVIWNGEVYDDLVCWSDGEYDIITPKDENFPFYIDDDYGNGLYMYSENVGLESATIIKKNVVYKFDETYIPDTIARKTDIVNSDITWENILNKPFGEKTIEITWDGNTEGLVNCDNWIYRVSDMTPSLNEVLNCTFDGTYSSPDDSGTEVIKDVQWMIENNFIIEPDGNICIIYEDDTEIEGVLLPRGTYFIKQEEENWCSFVSKLSIPVVDKIDEKFITDNVVKNTDMAWENIANKPFWEDGFVIEWNNTMDTTNNDTAFDGMYVKISDLVPAMSELQSANVEIHFDGEIENVPFGEYGFYVNKYGFGNEYIIVVYTECDEFPSTGVYYHIGNSSISKYVISYGDNSIHQLEEKYIPDTIARTNMTLPMPVTASVGQFIVVSAVDENGVVTATDTITLPRAEEVAF